MSEAADKLMGIPLSKMLMTDPKVGLTPEQTAAWQATHETTEYKDIPTAQEVANGGHAEPDEDDTDTDVTPQTEEQRLRCLLAAWAKSIWEYFCAKK